MNLKKLVAMGLVFGAMATAALAAEYENDGGNFLK